MDLGYYMLITYHPERDGSAADVYGRLLEQAVAAESLGFGTVWATEHHFHPFGGMTPSPQLLLTAVSQRTRRVRLGTSVSIISLHHPLRIAEDFAMLDVLSGGRLEFGAGRGMALAGYHEMGIEYVGSQDRMKEALTLIEQAWTHERVSFQGQFYQCPEINVLPRPLQQPRPPIWVTASVDPESFRWIGERGYDLMILPWLFPTAPDNVQVYREARAAAGHTGPERIMAMSPTHLADSEAQARTNAESCWAHWQELLVAEMAAAAANRPGMSGQVRGMGYDTVVNERRMPFGTVDRALALVRWLQTIGVTHLGLTFYFGGMDHTAALHAMELWAREVAPAMREASPGGASR